MSGCSGTRSVERRLRQRCSPIPVSMPVPISTACCSELLAPEITRANPRAGVGALVGSVDGPATLAAERTYLLAFFDRFLRGNREPLLTRTPGPFLRVRLTVGR